MNKHLEQIKQRNIIKRHCQEYFAQRGDVITDKLVIDFAFVMNKLFRSLQCEFTTNDIAKLFTMEYCLYFGHYKTRAKQILRDIGFPELAERDEFDKFNYLPNLISMDNVVMPDEINR